MLARFGVAILVALMLGAASASAQNVSFTRRGAGARAAGMADTFVAVSDDGTAASWNPAGLAQLRKPELSVVGTTNRQAASAAGFRTRDDLAAYTAFDSSYQSTLLDFASLAVPVTAFGKPLTFQASWRRLYSLDYRENVSTTREPLAPEGPPAMRFHRNSDVLGSIEMLSVAGAIKVTPRLAFGTSLNLVRGDWSIDDSASETALDETKIEFAQLRQDDRIRGDNFNVGVMLTYPRWSAGIVYQGPLHTDYHSSLGYESSLAPAAEQVQLDGSILFARGLALGGAWRPASRWTVALDLTWIESASTIIDTPETGPVSLFDQLPEDRTATRDTISLNAGAECLFHGEGFVVPLRFGAAWEPQPGRSPYTRDPADFVMLAAGTGYNTNRLKLDAALQYRWSSYRDGASFGLEPLVPLLPAAVGERSVNEWLFKFSLILRVTDSEKLRRGIARIFGGGA